MRSLYSQAMSDARGAYVLYPLRVVPAKAGTHASRDVPALRRPVFVSAEWVPAFAGMTKRESQIGRRAAGMQRGRGRYEGCNMKPDCTPPFTRA